MDLVTLINNISGAALSIDIGRKGFGTRGKEQEGRISYGIDPIEKELLKQRLSNLSTAQSSYIEKQKKAMKN